MRFGYCRFMTIDDLVATIRNLSTEEGAFVLFVVCHLIRCLFARALSAAKKVMLELIETLFCIAYLRIRYRTVLALHVDRHRSSITWDGMGCNVRPRILKEQECATPSEGW